MNVPNSNHSRAAHAAPTMVLCASLLAAGLGLMTPADSRAADSTPAPADVHGPAPVLLPVEALQGTDGAASLRFGDLFVRPVGPKGLEPTSRLLALAGERVSMVGYLATMRHPTPGRMVLTPLPVEIGDEDEQLADDLPPSAVFVHLSGIAAAQLPSGAGALVRLVGRLAIGPLEEPDGRVSSVRLLLDAATSRALLTSTAASGSLVSSTLAP